MINKLLVANRGEIAVRAFRAAYELGIPSVAVYPHEDRLSLHRQKADEAYEIGERGHPVRAYLDVDAIVATALRVGADAVYPGYGFLSESPELAEACERAGLTFVGPPAPVLRLAGNKIEAVAAARRAGLPVLRSLTPEPGAELEAADDVGFPLFVKAAAGGGGRGLRRVERREDLLAAVDTARREAEAAFGDPTVFLEQAVERPRHIEVQVLADGEGHTVHLRERDCSVQRRHQKVVEIAPAPRLDPLIVRRLCADAVAFAREIGYVNAGTVEFLVDDRGEHVFIEMNPRIQVEHTVTEEVTGVDLVQSQLRIAGGETLSDLGIEQENVTVSGFAVQCRITTEDPANGFRPDTGRISAYRSPGGAGVRLDTGTAYAGAEISPHFDSLLVKLTSRGRTFEEAVRRSARAVAEFRIRGVASNIPFLLALLDEADFRAGGVTTSYIADHPGLLTARSSGDRATRLVRYLADVTVNKPHGDAPTTLDPAVKLPSLDASGPLPEGSRDRLLALGPARFAAELRAQTALAVTDTTFRDAHQSLLATRVRTYDLVAAAPHLARSTPQFLSLEAWGGATYDVALRFLGESPWDRLAAIREAAPNLCLQMLLRGRNTVGYTPYPDSVARAFVTEAAATGVDIFRVFDALNDVERMRPAIDAVLQTHALVEGTLCYTGDLSSPGEQLYTLDYYLRLAEQLVDAGVHVLCIKDMAGLLRAPAARTLVTALRERFDLPVHLHTHDTAGGQLATYLAAIEAGVDAVDGAAAPLSGTTSQPPLQAIVAHTDYTERATGLSLDALTEMEPYWEAVRKLYAPFEMGLPSPTGRVYHHEIPGGQLSNLRQQAVALGLGDRFEEIERLYAAADRILGRLVKVTPSSKVVGDLALHLVAAGADPAEFAANPETFDIPDSVIGFLAGELGDPPGGWPEPFRGRALGSRAHTPARAELTREEEKALDGPDVRDTLDRLLFPAPAKSYRETRAAYGNLSVLPTGAFLYGLRPGQEVAFDLEPGVRVLAGLEAVGTIDEAGFRQVICTVNGQLRTLSVRDRSVVAETAPVERADASVPGQIPAPFDGSVTPRVEKGAVVAAGDVVATIEAMKMEAAITTPVAGTVARIVVPGATRVQAGDLLLVIE
ncbi:2-oxoglutarate carboxylase small subunit [Actinomadura rubteroloni]|uniref:Pyruvate carboxylase n=1 Tax=Actinomadura rubteroloni TaxID=1926885 RepID=A0A2P4UQG2_9ACTN|nr:pyruvate carboxylase [Actinomadura rubteroloni]POM27282.1 2-oxoglutarate carboxylase small subunit [Actinomadura rubteroloni]